MSFNPNEFKVAGTSKSFDPGQVFGHIADLKWEAPAWAKDNGVFISVVIEGPDLGEGFEGFQRDKNEPSLGNHKGKVATVRSGNFPFSDFTTKAGKFIERDKQIFDYLGGIALQMGKMAQLTAEYDKQEAAGGSFDTIEEYFELVREVLVDEETTALFSILGEPYTNQKGNESFSLQFPKSSGKMYPYAATTDESVVPATLLVPATYLIPKYVKPGSAAAATPAQSEPVTGFGGQPGVNNFTQPTVRATQPAQVQDGDDDNDLPF